MLGTMAAITPTGIPISHTLFSRSSRKRPTVFIPRIATATVSDAKRFLMVLSSTLPKPVSFTAISASKAASLEKAFAAGAEVTPEALKKAGIIHDVTRVKVLANGTITKALKVSAHGFSATAKAAIEKAGGTVTVIEQKTK